MSRLTRTGLVAVTVALAVLVPPGSAGAAKGPPAAGTVYGGHTAHGYPIVVTLDRSRTAIKTVGLYMEADYYVFGNVGRGVPVEPPRLSFGDHVVVGTKIARSGAFEATGRAVGGWGEHVGLFTYTLSGKVRGGQMRGTVRAALALNDPATGQPVKTVKFGTVRWMAVSEPGRIFGGMTADRYPVVIELNSTRRQARSVRIPWHASSETTGWALSETLGPLRLSRGRYTDAWSEHYIREDGGHNTFDYRFALRVTGTKASGTIQVNVVETDAAGAVEGTYDSGVVGFKARSS